MAIRLLSAVVMLVLFAFTASAQQIFKWKDKKGQWHFSDTPPPGVTAEKVKGLDISPKSSPATSPFAIRSKYPPAGSGSKEEAASKILNERPSDVPRKDIPSRWILSSGGKPWESFDSEEACEIYKQRLIASTVQQVQTGSTFSGGGFGGGFSFSSPSFSSYSPFIGSHCHYSDEFKPSSKEADVIVVLTQVGRDQRGVIRYILAGRVFNRGQTTAKNVVVKYQIRNARGTTVRKGEIRTVPHDIAGLTSAEYRSPISGGAAFRNLSVHTEVDWSKK